MNQKIIINIIIVVMLIININFTTASINQENTAEIIFTPKNNHVEQLIKYNFPIPINSPKLTYEIKNEVKNIQVKVNDKLVNHNLIKSKNPYIEINYDRPIYNITLYFENTEIFKKDNIHHFLTRISLNKDNIENSTAKLVLEPGFSLHDYSYIPENGLISSNGKDIILIWEQINSENDTIFSFKYIKNNTGITKIIILSSILVLIMLGIINFKIYKKNSNNYLFGFREDEKEVIEFIKSNQEVMQKELQNKFSISRAKATRITKKLESKRSIEKISLGRKNKLMWLGMKGKK